LGLQRYTSFVVCAVTVASVFGVLASRQVQCVLCACPLGIITVQTFHSSGVTATDSHTLVREPPSSQNSGSFNDVVRDASVPDIDD